MIKSKYQKRIDKEYVTTSNNIGIKAAPGSGKTTTLLGLLKLTPRYLKVVFCAFNNSIAEELKQRVPEGVRVGTIHSIAYSMLRNNIKADFKLTEYKNINIFKNKIKKEFKDEKKKFHYLFFLSNMYDLYRVNLCKDVEELKEVLDKVGVSYFDEDIVNMIHMKSCIDKYNNNPGKEWMIDFTDMLYLVKEKVNEGSFVKYDVVMVDECQDLTLLQQWVVERLVKDSGRTVFVGDEYQSIYSFMGASPHAFKKLRERPRTTILPLSVSYRCPKKVVERANKVFEGAVESYENNEEGVVREGTVMETEEGDYILCRNNYPLVEVWLLLTSEGKKCHIMGKEIGRGLVRMLDKLDYNLCIESQFDNMLKDKFNQLRDTGITNPKKNPKYIALLENISILKILKLRYGTYISLKEKVNEIFNDNSKNDIVLSTIHKAKGLEADRVFIVGYEELLPSQHARTPLELFQEECLKYVAITRAKKELIFVKYNG